MDNKTLTSASTPYTDLVYGTAENDCLVPCQTTEITEGINLVLYEIDLPIRVVDNVLILVCWLFGWFTSQDY